MDGLGKGEGIRRDVRGRVKSGDGWRAGGVLDYPKIELALKNLDGAQIGCGKRIQSLHGETRKDWTNLFSKIEKVAARKSNVVLEGAGLEGVMGDLKADGEFFSRIEVLNYQREARKRGKINRKFERKTLGDHNWGPENHLNHCPTGLAHGHEKAKPQRDIHSFVS